MVDGVATNRPFGYVANLRELEKEVDKYKQLWNEETELVEMLQKDKDFIDLKLMRAMNMITIYHMDEPFKTTLLNLLREARARV